MEKCELIKVNDLANFRKINSMIDGNAQNVYICAEKHLSPRISLFLEQIVCYYLFIDFSRIHIIVEAKGSNKYNRE